MTGENPRDLLRVWEDLTDEERARVQKWLDENPEERTRWDRVLRTERLARDQLEIPPLDDESAYRLQGDDHTQEERSRRDLLARTASGRSARQSAVFPSGRERWWRGLFTSRMIAFPVAVAAVGLLLFLSVDRRPPAIRDLSIRHVEPPGNTRSPRSDAEWRSGDAFALEFRVTGGFRPVVFHLDPDGLVSLVHPVSGSARPLPVGSDGFVRLPAGDERWVLRGEGGTETFFVTASDAPSDVTWEARARDATAGVSGSESVARLRDWLEKEIGPVEIIQIQRAP